MLKYLKTSSLTSRKRRWFKKINRKNKWIEFSTVYKENHNMNAFPLDNLKNCLTNFTVQI
jgi:hypothetical protein